MLHMSKMAEELCCKHCYKEHSTDKWPVNGDMVPFYYQLEPGNYSLEVTCPHCGKNWYVVWDHDPGPIKLLDI